MRFHHQRLQVYHKAIEAVCLADEASARLPPRWGSLGDQLRRAALSIGANIAEGAMAYAPAEQRRFYRIAKRSAGECSFYCDFMDRRGFADAAELVTLRSLLYEIVCMLTALITRKSQEPRAKNQE